MAPHILFCSQKKNLNKNLNNKETLKNCRFVAIEVLNTGRANNFPLENNKIE